MKPKQKAQRHPKRNVKTEQGALKYVLILLKAVATGLLVTALLLLLFSFVMSRQNLSLALINPMAIGALIVGSMISGFLAARMLRERGMGIGALSGLLLYLLLLIGAAMMGPDFGATALIKLVIAVVSGAIGGILGVNVRSKRK